MDRIMLFNDNVPQIGLFTRNTTQGVEYEMVQEFIDFYCHKFLRDNKKSNLAVFIEPRITSGFPDVVLASYLPSIADNWSEERKKVDVSDLKILSYLIHTGGVGGERLITQLKMKEKQILISLERLLDASLITYRNKSWKPKELRSIFSIMKLVSVEAKIGDVSRVIEQSFINTWFASHSYALTSSAKPHSETIKAFSKHGLGLYCKGNSFHKVIEAKPLSLPSSYQSLQFNEWIGNKISM
jgi:hypothetical protein